ncbi:hypothetical protein MRX96_025778 [Rhipicephalus microplus]
MDGETPHRGKLRMVHVEPTTDEERSNFLSSLPPKWERASSAIPRPAMRSSRHPFRDGVMSAFMSDEDEVNFVAAAATKFTSAVFTDKQQDDQPTAWSAVMKQCSKLAESITDELQSSTGYLYVLFMEKYHVNRETASWPESIIMLTQNLGGFVVTVLRSRIHVFYVTLFAAILCCAGLVGAAFAPDMKWMSVMLGGVYGTGSGASIISFTVFTMLYFDKYRATATSCKYIGWAASGLAGPLVFSAAVVNYGLSGSLLIVAAIGLNALPLDMFLRRPRPLVFKFPCRESRNLSSEKGETGNALTRNTIDMSAPQENLKNARPLHCLPKWKPGFNAQVESMEPTKTSRGGMTSSYEKGEIRTSQTSLQVIPSTSLRRTSDGNGESRNEGMATMTQVVIPAARTFLTERSLQNGRWHPPSQAKVSWSN